MIACARLLAAVGLLLIAVHFMLTAVYLNPVSVIGLAWQRPSAAYLEPLLRQRWALFAPDPPLVDRRLDYQCERGPWHSRSDVLLETHARRRFGPAGRLRRLETAAIVATVGAHDPILDALLTSQVHASDEQRERIEQLLAQRAATSIATRETAYRLILAYCREQLGRDPLRMRYRIVTRRITPFSRRNAGSADTESSAVTLPWLAPDELDSLEHRAAEALEAYERSDRVRAERS